MPPKITSKNLSYDNSAPPFLAALRAQAAGATGPDPLLALVVDEDGNVVNLEVDKDGIVKEPADHPLDPSTEKEPAKESESKAAIGGRKRKVGKVIGEAAEEPTDKETDGKKDKKGDVDETVKNRKPKKKAKKIKLSFDEDEG